jgi:hypothetical protein
LAVASQTTPFLQVYPFTWAVSAASVLSGSYGTICANPAALPAGGPAAGGHGVAWRPQGDFIALAMSVTPYLYVVPFNRVAGTFGAALTISAQVGAITSVRWSPDGQYLFATSATSPYLMMYSFATSTIGATVGFTNNGPTGAVNDFCVHPSGEYGIATLSASPYIAVIPLPTPQRDYIRMI